MDRDCFVSHFSDLFCFVLHFYINSSMCCLYGIYQLHEMKNVLAIRDCLECAFGIDKCHY